MKNKQLEEDMNVVPNADDDLIQAVKTLMSWPKPDCEGYGKDFDTDWNNLKDLL